MDIAAKKANEYKFNRDAFLRSLASSPYSGLEQVFLVGPIPERNRLTPANVKMITFGLITALLYVFLFKYQDSIVHFANLAHEGNHIYFLVPIFIALVFSYAHGTFTANFWESLDVRSKKRENN